MTSSPRTPHQRNWSPDRLAIYRSINAQAESLIGLYKLECVRPEGPWRGVDDLELGTLNWVHWFNQHRLHSALGYAPPTEFEREYYRQINPQQQPLSGELARH